MNTVSITASGSETYSGEVTVGVGTTLTSTGNGAVTFGSTVNGAETLAVNTGGLTTFGGAVGALSALTSVTTDALGTTQFTGSA